jgi:hypothetical protein
MKHALAVDAIGRIAAVDALTLQRWKIQIAMVMGEILRIFPVNRSNADLCFIA